MKQIIREAIRLKKEGASEGRIRELRQKYISKISPRNGNIKRDRVEMAKEKTLHQIYETGGRQFTCCPFHAERTPSLHITGNQWYCFGCGEGGDTIAFVMRWRSLRFLEAVDYILGAPIPPRKIVPPRQLIILSEKKWIYMDAGGNPVTCVCRQDTNEGKRMWQERNESGVWVLSGLKENLPLYNLPEIVKTEKTILVVEGEKARDAAEKFYPEYCCTTWIGGTNAIYKTDWKPLIGKKILLWPDNDDAGREAMKKIAEIVPAKFIYHETDIKGWDIGDAKGRVEFIIQENL